MILERHVLAVNWVCWAPELPLSLRGSSPGVGGALAAGREKEEELSTTSLEFEYRICIEKVNAKCWLAEMTLIMTSLPLVRVCLHSRSFSLPADWRKSDSSVDGEPQGNHRWNSNSRDVVASSPSFFRPVARTPRRACSQASYPSALRF